MVLPDLNSSKLWSEYSLRLYIFILRTIDVLLNKLIHKLFYSTLTIYSLYLLRQ